MIPPPASQGGVQGPKSAYVYLLCSLSTGNFYLGWTTDVQRRLEQHNAGESRATRARGPWQLVACEAHPTLQAAKDRERMLKRRHRMRMFFTKRALAAPLGSVIGLPSATRRQVGG